jgi:ankyrin repeat protein
MSSDSAAPTTARVSRRLWIFAIVALALNAALAARLVWEQTALTWQQGPQMIGFSLVHGPWAPIILAPFLLLILGVWVLVLLVDGLLRGRRPSRSLVALGAATLLVAAAIFTPDDVWQSVFATRLMHGPHAGEFLTGAAASGHRRTVLRFLAHGATIGVTDRDSTTALHAAAAGNQPEMIDLLLARGAAIDAIDRCGDSPLQTAVGNNSQEAARRLRAHGARLIHGTPEQRDRVIAEDVAQDIAELDRESPLHKSAPNDHKGDR